MLHSKLTTPGNGIVPVKALIVLTILIMIIGIVVSMYGEDIANFLGFSGP